ncbi:MAG TPA: phosphotransferase [Thermoanaerobaculia bacterium]|nr:phosphotransferase [Thermoanaerobaculia bacterium]
MTGTPAELETYLRSTLGEEIEIDPLLGDASVRAYYRVSAPGSKRYMVAYYPEAVREVIGRFLRAWESIHHHARVPGIHGACEFAVIQEDVGDVTLFEMLEREPERAYTLYRRSIDLLVEFQRSPAEAGTINPPFTKEDFLRELEMTGEFWVRRMCGVDDPGRLARLGRCFEALSAAIARHPYVLCHRDFHGQNLHIVNDDIFMIDFQDLRMGPDTYDVASLLRDRGVARSLGPRAERALIDEYRDRAGSDCGLPRRYFETLLQRSVKIVGTFARQSIVRERHHYLAYIPPTLESIRLCVDELPDYRDLLEAFPLQAADAHPALTSRN